MQSLISWWWEKTSATSLFAVNVWRLDGDKNQQSDAAAYV